MWRLFDQGYMNRVINAMNALAQEQSEEPAVLEEHARLIAPLSAAMSVIALVIVAAILAAHAHWHAWLSGVAIGGLFFVLYRAELRSGHRTTRRLRNGPIWLRAIVSTMLILAFLCLPAAAVALWLLGPVAWLASSGIIAVAALAAWTTLSWWWLQRTPVIFSAHAQGEGAPEG